MKVNHKIILFSLIGGLILSSAAAAYYVANNHLGAETESKEESENENGLMVKEENNGNFLFNIKKKAAGDDNSNAYVLTVTYQEVLSGNDDNFTVTPSWVNESDEDVNDYIETDCEANYDATSGFCLGCKVTISCLKAFSTQIRLDIASSSSSGSVKLDYVAKITSFTVGGGRLADATFTSVNKDESSGKYLSYIDLSYALSDSTISSTVTITSCSLEFADDFFKDVSDYLYGKDDSDIIAKCKETYNQELSVYNSDKNKRYLDSKSCGVGNASYTLYNTYGTAKSTSRNAFALALIDALGKCNSNNWAKIKVAYTLANDETSSDHTVYGSLTIDEDALNKTKETYKNSLTMSSGSDSIRF